MKKLLAFKLAFLLLFSSLASLGPVSVAFAQANQSTCENGECIEKLIDRLENLNSAYIKQCLPSEGIQPSDLESYYAENGLTEECWKMITEINELESQLQKHQARLEEKLGCQNGDCKQPNNENSISSQIAQLTKVEENLACTIPKQEAIKAQCPADTACLVVSTAMGMSGYIAEMFMPEKAKIKNCHLGDDSCATQLVTGFLKSVVSFFEGAWDLLKMGGKYVGKKAGEFWGWVTGAEDHSSTAQLAMAKASEEPGVFDMLVKDFPGTMKKLFTALLAALKEWMKTDILCNKWSGAPHFSKCLEPTESFDCISCKALANGLCAVSGVVLAEIVPAFLTGGLLTAAKEGAKGAAKLAKLFKVSPTTMSAIKNSKAAKLAVQAGTKVDNVLKVTKGLQIAKVAVESALKLLRRYLLTPGRKVLKSSYAAIASSLKKGTAYVAQTRAGKILVFSKESLKNTAKIIIYPIDNPLTTMAFKAGQRTFARALKTGAAQLGTKTIVTSTLVRHEGALDNLLARIEEAKLTPAKGNVTRLEQELLRKIEPRRAQILTDAFKAGDVEFNEVIRHLYPELQYGDLAKVVGQEKILKAENDLYNVLAALPDSPKKDKLLREFQSYRESPSRKKVVTVSKTYQREEVLKNAALDDQTRVTKAFESTGVNPATLTPEMKEKLTLTIMKAHEHGDGAVYKYSFSDLSQKMRILKDGGFTTSQADQLVRSGLVGKARPEDAYRSLASISVEDVSPTAMKRMIDGDYSGLLSKLPEGEQVSLSRAIKHLENNGLSSDEVIKVVDDFKDQFQLVLKATDKNSDGASYLAEIIRKNRKDGLSDDVIKTKIDDAFKGCK